MNAKFSVVVICVEVIIYLLLHNAHDCTFKYYLLDTINRHSLYGIEKYRTGMLIDLVNGFDNLRSSNSRRLINI